MASDVGDNDLQDVEQLVVHLHVLHGKCKLDYFHFRIPYLLHTSDGATFSREDRLWDLLEEMIPDPDLDELTIPYPDSSSFHNPDRIQWFRIQIVIRDIWHHMERI